MLEAQSLKPLPFYGWYIQISLTCRARNQLAIYICSTDTLAHYCQEPRCDSLLMQGKIPSDPKCGVGNDLTRKRALLMPKAVSTRLAPPIIHFTAAVSVYSCVVFVSGSYKLSADSRIGRCKCGVNLQAPRQKLAGLARGFELTTTSIAKCHL